METLDIVFLALYSVLFVVSVIAAVLFVKQKRSAAEFAILGAIFFYSTSYMLFRFEIIPEIVHLVIATITLAVQIVALVVFARQSFKKK